MTCELCEVWNRESRGQRRPENYWRTTRKSDFAPRIIDLRAVFKDFTVPDQHNTLLSKCQDMAVTEQTTRHRYKRYQVHLLFIFSEFLLYLKGPEILCRLYQILLK